MVNVGLLASPLVSHEVWGASFNLSVPQFSPLQIGDFGSSYPQA